MLILVIVLSLFVGFGVACCITVWALIKSNEIGNSKNTMVEMDGTVQIYARENNVKSNYPV